MTGTISESFGLSNLNTWFVMIVVVVIVDVDVGVDVVFFLIFFFQNSYLTDNFFVGGLGGDFSHSFFFSFSSLSVDHLFYLFYNRLGLCCDFF